METVVIKPEKRRGRKRKNQDAQNVSVDQQEKKQAVETRSKALVGRYVRKEFGGSGVFIGKIVYYDRGLYRIDFEDGDCEDLKSNELREFLIQENDLDDEWLERRRKLDELVSKKEEKLNDKFVENVAELINVGGGGVEGCFLGELTYATDGKGIDGVVHVEEGDGDSSTDSCEYVEGSRVDVGNPIVPPPQLPPSSGNIGVPEEYVSHLFSVYSLLRSFSIRLFLSPFGLDDFVGSMNCSEQNTLLDSIHVSLMRALKRRLQTLQSEGSELASKCLRCIDWSLLDTLTWPVYVVQYLLVMGYTEGPEWKLFYVHALDKDYYALSAGRKLLILQILCDDVLDSEEIRAEIDMREESEVGPDCDSVSVIASESGPKRIHPIYSNTSASKDKAAMEIIAESNKRKSSWESSSLGFKAVGLDAGADVDRDDNNDECRLCGMDGTLLCCDGCPSVYHSRCIGVLKMSIPEGAWYCPECAINRTGPTVTKGTSLRGAEIFGVDSYGQVFLGTCNHLLVLKVSVGIEPCCKYYNQNDILCVLLALHSSVQHIKMYKEICKGILDYWEIPEDVFALTETAEIGPQLVNIEQGSECCNPSLTLLGKESHNVSEMVEGEHFCSCVTDISLENTASYLDNDRKEPGINMTPLGTMPHLEHSVHWRNSNTTVNQACYSMDPKLLEQPKIEYTMSAGSVSQLTDPSDLIQPSLPERSNLIKNATCISGNSNGSHRGHVNGICLAANMYSQHKEVGDRLGGRGDSISAGDCLFTGSSFKSHSYINNYVHGDFAASAAANLAVLSSEEKRISGSHALDNDRKIISANASLQVKAFSSTAVRFFWPSTEKKLVEIPREKCGWCLSCKASVTKRGCLLNAAALNAFKGATKILAGLRPTKNLEGSLCGIAAYVMLMEESLRGLTLGPFLSAAYRKQWRKQVEQATSSTAIKILLLELEKNIRVIALSADWVKLVDDCSAESSAIHSSTTAVGSTQKRGPGRRGRKPSATSEVAAEDREGKLTDFHWWRGGMLSKLILQKGTLPCSMIKKASRQGGRRKITGIHYAEASKIPKKSRQLVWRSAVEMSKTASQLAFQVRCLDLHVRWSDLVRPEQSLQDGKDQPIEVAAFRNALICDKKIVEYKIRYGISIGNQKHFPSRVTKHIIEVEQSRDGKEKYWFFESCVPLYLIKEYEENMVNISLPLSNKTMSALSRLQRIQLKTFRTDIFSHLLRKRDSKEKCCCASCQLDVLLGNAVRCSACQGYCHEHCTVSSTALVNEEVEFLITCKQCHHAKALTETENRDESPTSPLLLQGQEFCNAVTVTKRRQVRYNNRSLESFETLGRSSEMKSSTQDSSATKKNRSKIRSWGLIWKKNNCEDSGIDFRLKNILLKDNLDINWLRPDCYLCHQPYNSDLMYIRCQTCTNWYHAEAVELPESKIFDVVGFKCCRCRRIKSPKCPYSPSDSKNQSLGKKSSTKARKKEVSRVDVDSGDSSVQHATKVLATEQEVEYIPDGDLLLSRSRVEQLAEHNSDADIEWNDATTITRWPQKLRIRRHMKGENDLGSSGNYESQAELSGGSSPHLELNVSANGTEDNMMFDYECPNYEDKEFEPHTYFSFTELLTSDDGCQMDGVDPSGDITGKSKNLSTISRDGIPDDTYGQKEPTTSLKSAVDITPCKICSLTKPIPDLSCQICGLWMHSHCSPLVELSSSEGVWRCVNCRDWV